MAPNLTADVQLGNKERPATWRAISRDGATLPPRLAKTSDAIVHITSGETYDFEFQADTLGEIPLQVKNLLGEATLVEKIIVP